jgi:GH15 family glucan-1,4-alpha-glucosidase
MLSLLISLLNPAVADVDAWASYPKLPSANGHGVVVLNEDNEGRTVLDQFSDRIYKRVSADSDPVRDLLYDTYFGIDGNWLRDASAVAYVPGTGILQINRRMEDLSITEYAWAPMGLEWPGFVQMLKISNTGEESRSLVVNTLHNVHVGSDVEGKAIGNESIWASYGQIIEKGAETGLGMRFDTRTPNASHTCDKAFETAGAFDGQCGTEAEPWINNDQVGGFEWSITLETGDTRWFEVTSTFFHSHDHTSPVAARDAWTSTASSPEIAFTKELQWWSNWHLDSDVPDGLSTIEQKVYKQSLTFLKMAQVAEEGDAHGQIPASFPTSASVGEFTHQWNITWVRDQAYAIRALTQAGHIEEAEAALAFTLQGKANHYVDQVGMEYGLSVCRMYGDGTEWSDDDGTGPNIELDNFGLTLWAIGEWVKAGGDIGFIEAHRVFEDVADVLVATIDDTQLVQPDSSIWERHWNGNEKHFTYTSAWAVRGLMEAHELALALEDTTRAETYLEAAQSLQEGICSNLVNLEYGLVGNLEEAPLLALDMAVVDTFNNHTLNGQDDLATQTLNILKDHLSVESGHGFKRNDDGDVYDEHEWVVMDLRMAEAYRRNCKPAKAQALEDWVTNQAMENHLIIPELMEPATAAYAGPAPMMGFGAGAYVLAMNNRSKATSDCEDSVHPTCDDILGVDTGEPVDTEDPPPEAPEEDEEPVDTGDTGGAPPAEKGCSCAATSLAPSVPGLLLLLPWLARRREIIID